MSFTGDFNWVVIPNVVDARCDRTGKHPPHQWTGVYRMNCTVVENQKFNCNGAYRPHRVRKLVRGRL